MGNCIGKTSSGSGDIPALSNNTAPDHHDDKPAVENPNVDLFDDDLNISKLVSLLKKNSPVQSVRLHGSRNVQSMLADATQEQLQVLIASDDIPVILFVAGDVENVKVCARYTLESWQAALQQHGLDTTTQCHWQVSNHINAVSMTSIDTEISQFPY